MTVTPKPDEPLVTIVRGSSAQAVPTCRALSDIPSPDQNLSFVDNASELRKKRKVSFAPGPPTSFSPPDGEVSKPESMLRRYTRSSSQTRKTRHAEVVKEEVLLVPPLTTAEKMSDEESTSSCASSVASTSDGSISEKMERLLSLKLRGRSRKNRSLAKQTKTADEEGATSPGSESVDARAKVMVPSNVGLVLKAGIISRQSRARGEGIGYRNW